jgi:hypothetical protein
MKIKELYLVLGSTGEYSDFRQWPVAVFTEKKKAELLASICKNKADRSYEEKVIQWQKVAKQRPFIGPWPTSEPFQEDPDAIIDGDTQYEVVKVPFNPQLKT